MKYNMLIKRDEKYSFIFERKSVIATNLSEKDFEKIRALNMDLLKDYSFVKYQDTDFTWWSFCTMLLTKNKLYKNQCFDIDWYGNITRY